MLDLKSIKDRHAETTPGRWGMTNHPPGDVWIYSDNTSQGEHIVNVGASPIVDNVMIAFDLDVANGRFIAEAHQDVPALVTEVEKLRKLVLAGAKDFRNGHGVRGCPHCTGQMTPKLDSNSVISRYEMEHTVSCPAFTVTGELR